MKNKAKAQEIHPTPWLRCLTVYASFITKDASFPRVAPLGKSSFQIHAFRSDEIGNKVKYHGFARMLSASFLQPDVIRFHQLPVAPLFLVTLGALVLLRFGQRPQSVGPSFFVAVSLDVPAGDAGFHPSDGPVVTEAGVQPRSYLTFVDGDLVVSFVDTVAVSDGETGLFPVDALLTFQVVPDPVLMVVPVVPFDAGLGQEPNAARLPVAERAIKYRLTESRIVEVSGFPSGLPLVMKKTFGFYPPPFFLPNSALQRIEMMPIVVNSV